MVKQPRASGFISVLVAVLMNQCIMMKRICEGAKAAACSTHFNVLVMFSLTDVTKHFTNNIFCHQPNYVYYASLPECTLQCFA